MRDFESGVTIFAWSGMSPDIFDIAQQERRVRQNPKALARVKETVILFLDEGGRVLFMLKGSRRADRVGRYSIYDTPRCFHSADSVDSTHKALGWHVARRAAGERRRFISHSGFSLTRYRHHLHS